MFIFRVLIILKLKELFIISSEIKEIFSRKLIWNRNEYYINRKSMFKKQIETVLDKTFNWEIINPETIEGSLMLFEVDNIINCTNAQFDVKEITDSITIYKISKNEQSNIYFSESLSHFVPLHECYHLEPFLLLLVFDKDNHRYLYSNSTRFYFQMIVDVGITEKDAQLKNDLYYDYKNAKEMLLNYHKFIQKN